MVPEYEVFLDALSTICFATARTRTMVIFLSRAAHVPREVAIYLTQQLALMNKMRDKLKNLQPSVDSSWIGAE